MNDMQQFEFAAHISDLLYRYIIEEITDDELIALHIWAYANKANQELFEEIANPTSFSKSFGSFLEFA